MAANGWACKHGTVDECRNASLKKGYFKERLEWKVAYLAKQREETMPAVVECLGKLIEKQLGEGILDWKIWIYFSDVYLGYIWQSI